MSVAYITIEMNDETREMEIILSGDDESLAYEAANDLLGSLAEINPRFIGNGAPEILDTN